MGMLGGASDMAANLARIISERTEKGESRWRIIAWLNLKCSKIDGATINPWWCTRLKPSGPRTEFAQAVGERQCWRISRTTAGLTVQTYVNTPVQKSAGRQYYGSSANTNAVVGDNSADTGIRNHEVCDRLLQHRQAGLVLDKTADRLAIEHPVSLCPSCPYRRAFAGIQAPKLDSSLIGGPAHGAAQCIHLTYDMTFADTPDRWVTRHLPNRFDVVGHQQSAGTAAGRSQRSFSARMTATNDDHVEVFGILHSEKTDRMISAGNSSRSGYASQQ
jgi:hypothetical protein